MDAEEFVSQTRARLPGRDQQLRQLWTLLEPGEAWPGAVWVWGGAGAGKAACLDALLEVLQREESFEVLRASCAEHREPSALFAALLRPLGESGPRCDTLAAFLPRLHTALHGRRALIVLRRVERMRADRRLLPAILRLRELCLDISVSVILVSALPLENFAAAPVLRPPLQIFFPRYTKDELHAILALHRDACINYALRTVQDSRARVAVSQSEVFANFLPAFLSVFSRACRDPVELRHQARCQFSLYCAPLLLPNADCGAAELWRRAAPGLRSGLAGLYLRCEAPEGGVLEVLPELPLSAKYLLLAAYLASYNPAREDKRLFVKQSDKKKKSLKKIRSQAVLSDKLSLQLGPSAFPLERLLAIFYAVVPWRAGLSAALQAQLGGLRALGLLAARGERFVCCCAHAQAHTLAHSLGFNLRKYLYDFI